MTRQLLPLLLSVWSYKGLRWWSLRTPLRMWLAAKECFS